MNQLLVVNSLEKTALRVASYSLTEDDSTRIGSLTPCTTVFPSSSHLELSNSQDRGFVAYLDYSRIPVTLYQIPLDCILFNVRLDSDNSNHRIVVTTSHKKNEASASPSISLERIPLRTIQARLRAQAFERADDDLCLIILRFRVHITAALQADYPEIVQTIQSDLNQALGLLPRELGKILSRDTAIFIGVSDSQRSNPLAPDRVCAYFPRGSQEWLRWQGISEDKRGCIQIFDFNRYKHHRLQWGPGCMLLHELIHAFHDKVLFGGFENPTVIEAYQQAMASQLYLSNSFADESPCFASINVEEYFAELSLAFLCHEGGRGQQYNRNFPHTRTQLREYDFKSFLLVKCIWETSPAGDLNEEAVGDEHEVVYCL